MEDYYPKYLTQIAIETLNKRLKLPTLSPYSQDWEYELADASRVEEFVTYYTKNDLTIDEKFALMALIISSYDDSITKANETTKIWNRIRSLILKDYKIHKNTIIYWGQEENDLENCFAVTVLIREVLKEVEQIN